MSCERNYVPKTSSSSSSSSVLQTPDPRPKTSSSSSSVLQTPDPNPLTQNPTYVRTYVSFRNQRRSPLNWNGRRQRGRPGYWRFGNFETALASSHHGGEYPLVATKGSPADFPRNPPGAGGPGANPARIALAGPTPYRCAFREASAYLPMYVRTYLRTCLTLPTYVLTYVRTYTVRTYVRTYVQRLLEVRTYVRTAYVLLLLRPPPSSSVLQTPDPKPPPPPPSSRPQTPDPKPPRSQHAPAAPGGAGAVAGAAYSIGGTSRTCLEIRTAARTFIGEHRFICIRTYVRMYRSCSNVWLKGLASCSIH